MNIIYSNQAAPNITDGIIPRSIFLAGPTPRDMITPSWRPDAITHLKNHQFSGTVFVPEHEVRMPNIDYTNQTEWENSCLISSYVILFWIPRNLTTLPGFTTNVEFGRFYENHTTLYGRPDKAPHTRYLDWLYTKFNTGNKIYDNLEDLIVAAISKTY